MFNFLEFEILMDTCELFRNPSRARASVTPILLQSNSIKPIEAFATAVCHFFKQKEQEKQKNEKFLIFMRTDDEVREFQAACAREPFGTSAFVFCYRDKNSDSYDHVEETIQSLYNNGNRNIIVIRQACKAEKLIKQPNTIIWFMEPFFASYFFKHFIKAEKMLWYYDVESENNWAVINGLIKVHHLLGYRIPLWLLEFYEKARPTGLFAARRNPEKPPLAFSEEMDKNIPRLISYEERQIFSTEAYLNQEPYITELQDFVNLQSKYKHQKTRFRNAFIKQYV